MDHLPSSVGPASWEVAALIMVPGSWQLSATPRPLLQSLGSGNGGKEVLSVSSITRPGELSLCCVVTSLCLLAGQ